MKLRAAAQTAPHQTSPIKSDGLWTPGMALFARIRFTRKALIISLAYLIPMVLLAGWQLQSSFERSLQAHQNATRQHVEVAHGVLVWAHAEEQAGRLTRQAAQALARSMVSGLRYDRNEYFWLNDMTPTMIMHPIKPALDGQDVSGVKDPNGLALFVAFANTVRERGEGFVEYQWPKPGAEKPVDKLSFVKGFAPWGWLVGSGIYIDDLRAQLLGQIAATAAFLVVALLVSTYLFLCFYRVLQRGQTATQNHLRAIAVVAEEVRTLAQLSSVSASEIRKLIQASVQQVDAGSSTVRRAGETISQIVVSSARVRSILDDIANGSQNQAEGVTRVEGSVQELESLTQQNAAMVEETAATAMTMKAQADDLSAEVQRFRLPGAR